jgi:hypothetical protein
MKINNKEEITFKDWLDEKQIEYTIEDEDVVILNNENDLRNYEGELLRLFPEIEFAWNVTPNHNSLN